MAKKKRVYLRYLRDPGYRQEKYPEEKARMRKACMFTNVKVDKELDDHIDTLISLNPQQSVENIYVNSGGTGYYDSCAEKRYVIKDMKENLKRAGIIR
jgi:hypothetical protein